jgi:hypothetical protein
MIDEALQRCAPKIRPLDPAALERIAQSVRADLTPVSRILPSWVLASALVLSCVVVAFAGAVVAGFEGIAVLGSQRSAIILAALGLLIAVMARQCVARWIPGSRLHSSAGAALAGCSMSLMVLFALLFRDYRTPHFIAAGITCVEQGVLHGIPSGILCAAVLRRGFAIQPILAALTIGALAGLTGVLFLEMHCTNIEAPHLLVWHTAVVPVSASLAVLTALVLRSVGTQRKVG